MGSGGIFHKFWCDKCQCYVDFSDFETCESICEYCEAREARENKARAEAAEAEVGRLRAELATMPRPEDRCNGEWPCEASTALAFAEAEAVRFARFLGECGYLVGIEVYSPDDIPVILDRLGDLHIRAEAAEAEVGRGEYRPQGNDMSNAIYADRVALLEQQLAESKAMADAVLSAAHAEYEASKENITAAHAERDAAIARGAAAERAAVVAWLREKANAKHPIERGVPSLSPVGRGLLLLHADRIERGDHRKEK